LFLIFKTEKDFSKIKKHFLNFKTPRQMPRGHNCTVNVRHVGILVTWLGLNGPRGIIKR